MTTNKIRKFIFGFLISFSLFSSRVIAQTGDGVFDSNDTVFDIIGDWITPINYMQDISFSSRTVAEISAILFIVSVIYIILETVVKSLGEGDDSVFDNSSGGLRDRLLEGLGEGRVAGRINLLMLFSVLLTLMMGPYLGPWVNTMIGTMGAIGAAGNIIFIIGVGVAIIVGFNYFTGGAGKALQTSGDAAASGASAFWNSDPVEAGRDAASDGVAKISDLAQASTTVDNFASSTAQLINQEVDNRNNDYCINMHQNPKGSRGSSCTVCGENIP